MMMVITPKHVGAVLMQILITFINQFFCASVGNKTLIISSYFTVRLRKFIYCFTVDIGLCMRHRYKPVGAAHIELFTVPSDNHRNTQIQAVSKIQVAGVHLLCYVFSFRSTLAC
jgi:hypothetical protein